MKKGSRRDSDYLGERAMALEVDVDLNLFCVQLFPAV